jgi:hypothetical protein
MPLFRGDRRVNRLLANRRWRQDGQNAWLARVRRLRKFRKRLIGDVLFRREKRLGGLARSHDLLAIVATRLALLLRAVGQELPRIGWLLPHLEGNSLTFATPRRKARRLGPEIETPAGGAGVFAEDEQGGKNSIVQLMS